MIHSRIAAWSMLFAQLSLSTAAYAEPDSDGQHQEADRLFQDGLGEMKAGKYDVACPHLAESYRIDPSPGALFTLAECEASSHKLASALDDYQRFVSSLTAMPAARRETFEERRRIAAGQISVLSVSAPEVTIDVAPDHASNLVVKFQGAVLPPESYGVGKRVDPGSYVVTAEVDGQTVWQRNFAVQADSRAQIRVQPASAAATDGGAATSTAQPAQAPQKTWLYVSGGVAVAGLTTGLITGVLAYGHKSRIDDNCPNLECNAAGRSAVDTARAEARVSTIGFTLGILGAGAAVALSLMASHSPDAQQARIDPRPRLRFDVGGDLKSVRMSGRF